MTSAERRIAEEKIAGFFMAFESMAKSLATIGCDLHPGFDRYLDLILLDGSFVKIEVGIGRAGCLSLVFSATDKRGERSELLTCPAPPRDVPFRFRTG
jgi:hypothetical protein